VGGSQFLRSVARASVEKDAREIYLRLIFGKKVEKKSAFSVPCGLADASRLAAGDVRRRIATNSAPPFVSGPAGDGHAPIEGAEPRENRASLSDKRCTLHCAHER